MSTTAHFYAIFAQEELGEFHDEFSPISLLAEGLDRSHQVE
ncbi:MAG: hypothetical protein ACOCXR_01080 [Phototrophicaceae bacterium]